ncbi:hypothetical protein DNTS_023716 [Danionella cerebrum]|uniref:Uncharacterized protein n=1 Tax=Danionella cerebrum TaxID=2873325 RepID=A0A553MMQ1_9TELE|nr:hypothetical protein DNTS_023716 [Danionella translucida]
MPVVSDLKQDSHYTFHTYITAAEKEAELLKQSVQRSEKELEELRAVFIEREEKQQRRAAKQEHQSRRWAQEIHTECVCLQELLKPSGPTVDIKHCPTVGDSLQTLQTLTKALQKFINDLKNELSCATLQLSHEEVRAKHQGPKDQREEEREEALIENQMKQAQEHLEEISSRSKGQLHLSDTDVYVHLLRQEELGELPNIKPQWEGKTKTNKPELELNPEVERVASKSGAERQRRLERLEDELRHLTLAGAVSQNSQGHLDVTSHKLLKHLQSRIHLLQTESQNQIPWTFKLNGDPSNLEGSYLDTIASDRQRWNHVPEKTFSS